MSHRERDSRDRDYERDHDRDRRDKDGHRRRRSRSKEPKTIEDIVGREVSLGNFDIDAEQRKLDILMQQRRERVERWRSEQAVVKGIDTKSSKRKKDVDGSGSIDEDSQDNTMSENGEEKKKGWTLDDEDDDEQDMEVPQDMDIEEEDDDLMLPKKDNDDEDDKLVKKLINKPKKAPIEVPKEEEKPEDDPDVDPLEAFMKNITAEVKSLRTARAVKEEPVGTKAKLVVGIKTVKSELSADDSNDGTEKVPKVAAKKKPNLRHLKGELLEQNQDAMEYSSEDEATTAEDLQNMTSALSNQSKMKQIKSVTLADVTFKPFRKNFYIEVPELAQMSTEEVDAYRELLEGIKVKGKNCPKPIKNWAQAGLSRRVMDVLSKYNYQKPTPIQAQAIPAIMSGRDLIGIAKTGSGKTLAFLLPMFRHILDQEPLESGDGPIGIILTPTRELATQIYAEAKKFCKKLNLRVVAVYGGTPISEQIGELKPGAEIVVCTPGRMIDMLAANNGRVTNLRRTTYVVLDEADRMFDLGFEPQVMRILDTVRPDRQMVMFSATFPRLMEALARKVLEKPIEVIVGGRSVVCKEVEQNTVIVSEDDKFLKLLEILGRHLQEENRVAIVFVDKQESADTLLKELMIARYTCLALHGGIDQQDRDSIISDFKHGRVQVLVATSVAARGLDVKNCCLVVNYDCPNHYEDYVHRVGRTGRAGTKGVSYTLITPDQGRNAGDVIKAFENSNVPVPEDVAALFERYKLEQQIAGKEVKTGTGGFSGRGFKFNEEEAQFASDQKKFQKKAFGLQDSDDEDENDLDSDIMTMLAPKTTVKQIAAPTLPPPGCGPNNAADPVTATSDKLDAARRLAAKLAGLAGTAQQPGASSSAEAFLKGDPMSKLGSSAAANIAKSIAEQRAERLHAKLNYIPRDIEYDEDGEMVRVQVPETSGLGIPGVVADSMQRFEEELEINDFPQQARWRVTSREALAQISEYSEAGLTVRGTFYAPGAKVPEGERKLYLAIEATNELAVTKARKEIIRLIKEELTKMSNSFQPVNKGRYKVV